MFGRRKRDERAQEATLAEGDGANGVNGSGIPLDRAQPFRKAILPVMACGAGLFSDGYINNVCARKNVR
jgi:hypothetical protein